jgi:hypothetical protein
VRSNLGFQCHTVIGDYLYFSSFCGNGLFRYKGNSVEHVGNFNEEGAKLFSDAKKYKERIYFVPLTASQIYFYDSETEVISSIEYGHKGLGDFIVSILEDNILYMFPSYYPGIMVLNLDTHEIRVVDDWINVELERCRISEDAYFRGDYVREGDVVYFPFCNAHAVLEFHLDDRRSIIHDVGTQGYSTIASDGSRFWMAPRKTGAIVSWDPITSETTEYQGFPEGFSQGGFVGSFYEKGYIWMFPETANKVLKVDTHTNRITEDELFSGICGHKWVGCSLWNAAFVYMRKEGEKVLLCTGRSGEVVIFRPDTYEIESFWLRLSKEDALQYQEAPDERYILFRNKKIRGKFSHESHRYDIGGYAEYIADCGEYIEECIAESRNRTGSDIGRSIYESIV